MKGKNFFFTIISITILTLICLVTIFFILDNIPDTTNKNYIEYDLKIKTNGNFTVYVPYIHIEGITHQEILSEISVKGEANISFIAIDNSQKPYFNLTDKSLMEDHSENNKALRIIGRNNVELKYKFIGRYYAYMTLTDNNTKYHWVYFDDYNQNTIIIISANNIRNYDVHWNYYKNEYNLQNGWNKIKIEALGGLY